VERAFVCPAAAACGIVADDTVVDDRRKTGGQETAASAVGVFGNIAVGGTASKCETGKRTRTHVNTAHSVGASSLVTGVERIAFAQNDRGLGTAG